MILDASALVAIAVGEPGAEALAEAIINAQPSISAPTYVEACIVIDSRRDPVISRRFDEFITDCQISIVPFTPAHAAIARQAYRDYGRGSGHPAGLNFGDCFSYALATERREPLLFVGDDFIHTDVRSAR